MLCRAIDRQLMTIFIEKDVIGQPSAVDNMLGLFRNVRFVRLKIEFISTTAELVRRMILQTDAAELCRTIIRT